jgi:hypothetical protein
VQRTCQMREWLSSDHGARLANVWARAFGQSLQSVATRIWSSARTLLIMPLCDPYRPEWHYMRGPGPKSRAKRLAESGQSMPPDSSAHKDK